MKYRDVRTGLWALLLVICGVPASGAVITISSASDPLHSNPNVNPGESFTMSFDGSVNNQVLPGLTAQAVFSLLSFAPDSGNMMATFFVEFSNTSSLPVIQSRVTGYGFNTTPALLGATSTAPFNQMSMPGQFPGGIQVDICASTGSCTGGGGGGIWNGPSAAYMTLQLTFAAGTTAADLSNWMVRYQSITTPLFSDGSGTGVGFITDQNSPIVPEPSTTVLMGGGLLGLALFLRFRSRLLSRRCAAAREV